MNDDWNFYGYVCRLLPGGGGVCIYMPGFEDVAHFYRENELKMLLELPDFFEPLYRRGLEILNAQRKSTHQSDALDSR